MRPLSVGTLPILALLAASPLFAVVSYEKGQRLVKGVQLMQDNSDPASFYYVPQYPRLATKDDGTYELLCIKYLDGAGRTSGGLFHALVEFTLPPEVVAVLEKELRKEMPNAKIVGPVPLMQTEDKGEDGVGSFQIVSAVLSNRTDGAAPGFTRSLVTSGKAPLLPGSKAAVAALLSQEGMSLLWESMTGPASDVSVAIHAYYEAAVHSYNARVTADVSTIYNHFSRVMNTQHEYTRRQVRNVVDDLQRNQSLKVEVLDRSAGLGVKSSDMDGILQAVTTKLTEIMFDHKSGWSADPTREAAVEPGQLLGRQERGWFSSVFGGAQDTQYFSDDQYVMKRRQDIQHNVFTMVLDKSTTIKVPVDTAGNLGGLYQALGRADSKYFRVVNISDPDYERRAVQFQIDGDLVTSFKDVVNFVSVNFRKSYPDKPAFTRSLDFKAEDVQKGSITQDITYPRLGAQGADWTDFEYQVRWSLRDGPTLSIPADPEQWIKSNEPSIALAAPFEKRVIAIDFDKKLLTDRGFVTAVVEFAAILAGKPKVAGSSILRASDSDASRTMSIYRDRGSPSALRISFYGAGKTIRGELQQLDSGYLFIQPPPAAEPRGPQ